MRVRSLCVELHCKNVNSYIPVFLSDQCAYEGLNDVILKAARIKMMR
jgi:hypothetical protein